MNANEIVNVLRACGNGNSVCEKCPFYIREDSNECRFNAIYESADTIEAQQHEIEQHIKWNEAHTKARVEQAELIDKLVRDKDEQAGRIMKLEDGLKKLRTSFQWLLETNRHVCRIWTKEKIQAINALLGGAEDGSSKDE